MRLARPRGDRSSKMAGPLVFGLAALGLSISSLALGGDGPQAGVLAAALVGPPAPLQVVVDIRPGICPNHLRLGSPLTVPVAILGDTGLDATNIDPGSVRISLEGGVAECAAVGWHYSDTGSLAIGSSPDCNTPRGDGFDDLCLDFAISDLVTVLGLDSTAGSAFPLVVTGVIVTGQGIEGRDQAIVIGGPDPDGQTSCEVGLFSAIFGSEERGHAGEIVLTYYTNVSDRITVAVYDSHGRAVATLVDADRGPGIYTAAWDLRRSDGRPLGPGDYFARVTNGVSGVTSRLPPAP